MLLHVAIERRLSASAAVVLIIVVVELMSAWAAV